MIWEWNDISGEATSPDDEAWTLEVFKREPPTTGWRWTVDYNDGEVGFMAWGNASTMEKAKLLAEAHAQALQEEYVPLLDLEDRMLDAALKGEENNA